MAGFGTDSGDADGWTADDIAAHVEDGYPLPARDADAPLLYAIVEPTAPGEMPRVRGVYGLVSEAAGRVAALGLGYTVALFTFDAPRGRTALEALAAEVDRRGRVLEGTSDANDDPEFWRRANRDAFNAG